MELWGHQLEKYHAVGDKVGGSKEAMGSNTCGSGLITTLDRAGDQIMNYTKKSMCSGP